MYLKSGIIIVLILISIDMGIGMGIGKIAKSKGMYDCKNKNVSYCTLFKCNEMYNMKNSIPCHIYRNWWIPER